MECIEIQHRGQERYDSMASSRESTFQLLHGRRWRQSDRIVQASCMAPLMGEDSYYGLTIWSSWLMLTLRSSAKVTGFLRTAERLIMPLIESQASSLPAQVLPIVFCPKIAFQMSMLSQGPGISSPMMTMPSFRLICRRRTKDLDGDRGSKLLRLELSP